MSTQPQRSPTFKLGGIAHLGRIIDKIRLRHAGQIQDYLSTSSNWTPLHSSNECVTEKLIRDSWTGSARICGDRPVSRINASRQAFIGHVYAIDHHPPWPRPTFMGEPLFIVRGEHTPVWDTSAVRLVVHTDSSKGQPRSASLAV